MPGGPGRGPRRDQRQRREWQKLGAFGFAEFEPPLSFSGGGAEDGTLSIDLSLLSELTLPGGDDEILVSDTGAGDLKRMALQTLIESLVWVTADLKWTMNTSVPTGWLECDGTTIGDVASGADHESADYEDLFNIVKQHQQNAGTESFAGGDVVTLPDQARYTLMGTGGTMVNGPDTDIGDFGGAESHALSVPQIPSHTHSDVDPVAATSDTGTQPRRHGTISNPLGVTGATGGSGAHNNVQPSLVAMLLIKV